MQPIPNALLIQQKIVELAKLLRDNNAHLIHDIDEGSVYLAPTSVTVTNDCPADDKRVHPDDIFGTSLDIDSFSSDMDCLEEISGGK